MTRGPRNKPSDTQTHHLQPDVTLPIQLGLPQFHLYFGYHLDCRIQGAPQLFIFCLDIYYLPAMY